MSMNELRERLAAVEQNVRDLKDWQACAKKAGSLPDAELDRIFTALRQEVQRRVEAGEDEMIRIIETMHIMEEVSA